MISRKSDIFLGVGILAGLGILFNEAMKIPAPRFEPMGSAMMPKAVLLIMAVLTVIEIIQALRKHHVPDTDEYKLIQESRERNQPRSQQEFRHQARIRIGVTFLALVAYVTILTFSLVNYFVVTFVFGTLLSGYLSGWSKGHIVIGICTITTILGLLYLLSSTMGLILPTM